MATRGAGTERKKGAFSIEREQSMEKDRSLSILVDWCRLEVGYK